MINKLFHQIKQLFQVPADKIISNAYRIIGIDDNYQNTQKVYVTVQVAGNAATFDKPVSELYQKKWLDNFSHEDVAHIAALYSAEQTNNLDLIKKFPKQTAANKSSVISVGILFTTFLILSNLAAFKIAAFGSISFAAGLVFFPLTYVFDDILTEVYGFKVSRRIIWMALLANTIVFLGTWLTIYLTPSPYWPHQEAYATIYQGTLRVFLASIISYFFGEFTNSIILAKLKVLTSGERLWLRAITSTVIGVGIDTLIFTHIAFLFIIPYAGIWQIIGTMYLFKVLYEVCALPITYHVSNYLKRKDNIDHYDVKTNFNPFSLEL
ncbi:queuosine precursor transporter [Legionella sp. PATHC038]|uniref:queuosine precursor transporter n=1 Tax=Legionella sheltonii TaxID=2992041 RepID=UPI002242C9C7|nr:queuosine precursor transporter [Legionella sp. PATHC038]MCW8397646.1 queuosine precursor transporter [Legionella sp. PATHC038]